MPTYVEIDELAVGECFLDDHDFFHETPTLWKVIDKSLMVSHAEDIKAEPKVRAVCAEIVKVGSDLWRNREAGYQHLFNIKHMVIPSTKKA